MAGGGTEVARAYVTIIPKSDGTSGKVVDSIVNPLAKGGNDAGAKAGKGFSSAFAPGIARAGKMLAGLGLGVAGASFMKDTVAAGKEFDSAMSQVAATLGLTSAEIEANVGGAGDTFDALRAKAQDMGKSTIYSASESADALNILAMSGYKADESIAMVEDVLHLAAAGSMDMASAAGYVSGAIKGFGGSAEDAGHFADLMAKGATLANTSVQQLGEAMSDGASGAAAYGQSADSMTVSLLRLAEQNEVGAAAGTALAAAYKNIYSPTNQAAEALEKLGVKAYDANGNARDFNDVTNELAGALSGYTEEEQAAYKQTIFGIQGLNAFNKMTVTGIDKQNEWKESLAGASDGMGEAAKQYDTMTDNLQGDVSSFQSALEGLQISLSDSLTPALRDFVQWGTEGLGQVTEYINTDEFKSFAEGALNAVKTGVEGVANAIKFLAENSQTVVPVVAGLGVAFAAFKVATGVSGAISTIAGMLPVMGAGGAAAAGGLTATAGAETAAGAAAGGAAGNMMRMGAAVLMVGGGVALAAVGIALLAQSAIAVANAGPGAGAAMIGMAAGIAVLAAGAAAIGPALTAGAVGMIAFGMAVLMIGAGVGIAAAGISLLAAQLPTVASFGTTAAAGFMEISAALLLIGPAALVAAPGLVALGAAGLGAAAGMAAFGLALGGPANDMKKMADATATMSTAMGSIATMAAAATTAVAAFGTAAANGIDRDAMVQPAREMVQNAIDAAKAVDASSVGKSFSASAAGGIDTSAMNTSAAALAKSLKGIDQTATVSVKVDLSGINAMKSAAASLTGVLRSTGSVGSSSMRQVAVASTAAAGSFKAVSSAVLSAMSTAKASVSSAVSSIKGQIASIPGSKTVTISFSKPHIPVPHYSISGSLDAKNGHVPTVSAWWGAEGGILTKATIFGAGEAGPEAVLPLDKLPGLLGLDEDRGGGDVNVYLTYDASADAEQMARDIARNVKRYRMAGAF